MQPDSDLLTSIAIWVTVVAGVATLALFSGTMLLRYATVAHERRRRTVIAGWRETFATAIMSADAALACVLVRRPRWAQRYLLEEWNRIRSLVDGESAANLATLAKRLELETFARQRLQGHGFHDRLLAIQALGYLGSAAEWATLLALIRHSNTALSATAAHALIQIDRARAFPEVMPEIIGRAEWPPAAVHRMLKAAGPGLITQPLCHAVFTAEPHTAVRLLRFAELAQTERIDQLVETLLRERAEPAVLAAAMRASRSQAGIPRVEALAAHDDWYVRVQAARLLGRVGGERDLGTLEKLLSDSEWWVRYRAAQAIVQLPFMGPNYLRRVRARQRDRYAADMMSQAMAEVGLA